MKIKGEGIQIRLCESEPCTCTESMAVYVASISVKECALYTRGDLNACHWLLTPQDVGMDVQNVSVANRV